MTSDQEPINPFESPRIEEPMAVATTPDVTFSREELPSRWSRIGAALIDNILLLLVLSPAAAAVMFVVSQYIPPANPGTTPGQLQLGMLNFLLASVTFVAINGYLLATRGQSIGKLVAGIKIVRYDRTAATFERVVVSRHLAFMLIGSVPMIGPLVMLIDMLCIFSPERRCLHDYLADTIVVRMESHERT